MKVKDSAWVLFAVVCWSLAILSGCDTHGRSANAAQPAVKGPVDLVAAPEELCDEQAASRFHKEENSDDFHQKNKNPIISDYTNPYDPAVHVCYVRIHSVSGNPAMVSDVVYDVGGQVYAEYLGANSQNKQHRKVSPSQCEIHIPGKADEKCTTGAQFDKLTKKYFGVTR